MRSMQSSAALEAQVSPTSDVDIMRTYAAEAGIYARTLFALDIETDNLMGFGLDPRNSQITEVAVCADPRALNDAMRNGFAPNSRCDVTVLDHGVVFAAETPSEEALMLRNLDLLMMTLPSGVISTWNGAGFDIPFLYDRAKYHGLSWGLRPIADNRLKPYYATLPGHEFGYQATWRRNAGFAPHRFLDTSLSFADPVTRRPKGLKSTARLNGMNPIELDRARIHTYSPEERAEYVMSDVVATRTLQLMRRIGMAA